MKYTSTRNNSKNICYTFEDALCSGYAPDGGLFVPINLPKITTDNLNKWKNYKYNELMYIILRLFIDESEIPNEDLKLICNNSLNNFNPPNINDTDIIPIVKINNIYVTELFYGPTYCFKDLGMRIVINILSYFAIKNQRSITLLVSTTGDTGPAAVQTVSDINNSLLTILIHYPYKQISNFQKLQLTTINSPYIHIVSFKGSGDDMDKPIKNLLSKNQLKNNLNNNKNDKSSPLWTGVNSYNIVSTVYTGRSNR